MLRDSDAERGSGRHRQAYQMGLMLHFFRRQFAVFSITFSCGRCSIRPPVVCLSLFFATTPARGAELPPIATAPLPPRFVATTGTTQHRPRDLSVSHIGGIFGWDRHVANLPVLLTYTNAVLNTRVTLPDTLYRYAHADACRAARRFLAASRGLVANTTNNVPICWFRHAALARERGAWLARAPRTFVFCAYGFGDWSFWTY